MREIKFRAWDSEKECWCINLGVGNILYEIHANKHHDINDTFVLQQFTGLHDKNGKEIWEGDLIRLSYPDETTELFTVVYTNYKARFQLRDMNNCGYGFDKSNRMEVIGNIYQNPELVKH